MYWLDGGRYIVTILMCLFEGSLNVVIKHSQCGTKYVLQLDNIKLVLYRMTLHHQYHQIYLVVYNYI